MAPLRFRLGPRDDTGFCAGGGGLWPAIQTFIEFFATNILAHAATIRVPAGTNLQDSFRRVITALFLPVSAGDPAFRALGRWFSKWVKSRKLIPPFGGKTLEAAATSGAVAICVPLEFAPLLAGRWERPNDQRRVVLLDGGDFWHSQRRPKLPFTPLQTFPRYVPFIVSSNTKFSGNTYRKKTISPSSSTLSGVVAVVQIVLAIRQLSLNYGTSINDAGLSSPYLIVIPYVLMSLVNLTAGILVSAYRQVTVLPMDKTLLPDINEAYLICQDNVPEVTKCQEPKRLLSLPIKFKSDTVSEVQTCTEANTNPVKDPVDVRPKIPPTALVMEKLKWQEDSKLRVWEDYKAELAEDVCTSRTQWSLLLVRFVKEEMWTSLWYRLHFKIEWRWKRVNNQAVVRPSKEELAKKEKALDAVIFFRHQFISTWIQWRWSFLKRNRKKGVYESDENAFREWLDREYPNVIFEGFDKGRLGLSHLFTGIFFLVLITAILAGLTRFHLSTPRIAAWLLVWMYAGPLLRYTWLNDHSMDRKPCLNPAKWILFLINRFLHIAIIVGICGSVAVISVQLFGDICNTTFSLSPGIWALVNFLIATFFFLIWLIVIGTPKVLGARSSCLSEY